MKACGEVRAIDFERGERARSERFDLVLDLSAEPLIRLHQPPQGYFAPGRDPLAQAEAARELAGMTGEFEKPKFFVYREKICAHSRSEITGCTQCIDICSTAAISADGDYVKVEPHLCMGCGACASVCPSGAMTYAYPRVADLGHAPENAAGHVYEGRREAGLRAFSQRDRRPRSRHAAGPARQGFAGAGHPARNISCCVAWHRHLAGRNRVRRGAGGGGQCGKRGAGVSAVASARNRLCAANPDGARLWRPSFHADRSPRQSRAGSCNLGAGCRAAGAAGCRVQSVERKAHDARFYFRALA